MFSRFTVPLAFLAAASAHATIQSEIDGGVVFPSLHLAASRNASVIAYDNVIAFHGAYGPPLLDGTDHTGTLSATGAFDRVGIGFGYNNSNDGSQYVQRITIGGAFRLDQLSFGAGMTTPIDHDGFEPNIHMGVSYRGKNNIQGTVVASNLDHGNEIQFSFGVGLISVGKYNLEVNARTPPMGAMTGPGSNYRVGLGLAFYSQGFGLGVNTGFNSNETTTLIDRYVDIQVSAIYWVLPAVAAEIIYNYNNVHTLQLAFTIQLPTAGGSGGGG